MTSPLHPKALEVLTLLQGLDEDDALDVYSFDVNEDTTDEPSRLLIGWLDDPNDVNAQAALEALAAAWKADPKAYNMVDPEAPVEMTVAEWLALGAPVLA